jgi:hypothetical protein
MWFPMVAYCQASLSQIPGDLTLVEVSFSKTGTFSCVWHRMLTVTLREIIKFCLSVICKNCLGTWCRMREK